MTDRELLEKALAALCQSSDPKLGYRRNELFLQPKAHIELYQEAIEALRARLARPEPSTYNSFGLMGGDKFVSKDSVDRDIV